ncbi:hypothetical protein CLOL250_01361 [Clostridium sp. L2-50]|nr:hypothetical protein CLOL250_01361 [Clostridium sp. L2-50]
MILCGSTLLLYWKLHLFYDGFPATSIRVLRTLASVRLKYIKQIRDYYFTQKNAGK